MSSPSIYSVQSEPNERSAWEHFKTLSRSSQVKIALGATAVAITIIAAAGAAGAGLTGVGMAFAGNPIGGQILGYSIAGLLGISAVALIGSGIAKKSGIEKALERAWKEAESVNRSES